MELASEQFEVRIPNLLGAIVAKSAAATEVVSATRFDKEKRERDLPAFDEDAHPYWSDGADRSDVRTVLDVLLGSLASLPRS